MAFKTVKTVAIVGTGLIGSSWAAFFLAKGFDVRATDPAPDGGSRTFAQVARMWPHLERIGLAPGASLDRLSFHEDLEEALASADFVQESGPERLPLKQALFQQMDRILQESVVIASSSSALMMSDIQRDCDHHPERCIIAHPFNPPHIMPLVEIAGGRATSAAVVDFTQAFFDGLGKKCIRLNKEIQGHVANRIAYAMYREAVWLVEQGFVSTGDADRAVSWGPGLRWGGMGPHLLYHLGGGEGGLAHFLSHLGETLETMWNDSPTPRLSEELRHRLATDIQAETDGESIEMLSRQRDQFLIDLIAMRNAGPTILSR
ncbi:3-hydroxyacyl-CoA dehydrogenase NAD-binding domain-containing protein [Sphingobium sp. H39-3-25]|uniref:3-hydroxyacyl-CoA dehydrogenase NAD-binding domain-containing protein n=1 Tax=Sphingobium arseniciresistens TaxID=3030834 RepID=UPI0023B9C0F1|nr:3-hydroxyacyl-CoA dehydrogenase NAD-binding domain-containing protein [Sphingobium arseniciresistens]